MGELKSLEIRDIPGKNQEEMNKNIEKIFEKLKNVEVINNINRNNGYVESSIYEEEELLEIEDGGEGIFNYQY